MNFENLLEEVGSFGRYQRALCFILIPLTTGFCGFTYYSQIFVLTTPPHICNQWIGHSALQDGGSASLGNINLTDVLSCNQHGEQHIGSISSRLELDKSQEPYQACSEGWTYDYKNIFPTLTSQNNWVCDENWKPYLIISFFWVGNTFGAWLFGVLSDKYGRRPVIAASVSVYAVCALISSFTSNFYLFLSLRFLVGSAHHTVSHLPFVYVVEQCGVKNRVIPLLTIMMSYTIASILSPLVAELIWDWKILTLVSTAPVAMVVFLYKWMPESPSWLATKGRVDQCTTNLEKIAKVNRKALSQDSLTSFFELKETEASYSKETRKNKNSILDVLKFKRLSKNILIVLILWMLGCFCYYGHCQNTSHLGENIFSNYLFGALVEIPAWCCPWLINRFGRKRPLSIAFLLSGIASFAYSFIPLEYGSLALGFALFGRMTITVAYYTTLQYGPEIFPTVIRGQGVAISETMGGVAIFVSPLIVYLGEVRSYIPLIIFGGLSVVGALGTSLLPETAGSALPQTLQEGNEFGKKISSST